MKKRGLVISLLVLLAVITSGFTYAFWAAGVTGASDDAAGSITIGEGNQVTTTVAVDNLGTVNESLVPKAYTSNPGTHVEGESYVDLTFDIIWNEVNAGATGTTSTVSLDNIVWSVAPGTLSSAQLEVMFDAVIQGSNVVTLNATHNYVVVRVSFEVEPGTQAIYEQLATGTLTATLTFLVANVAVNPVS